MKEIKKKIIVYAVHKGDETISFGRMIVIILRGKDFLELFHYPPHMKNAPSYPKFSPSLKQS